MSVEAARGRRDASRGRGERGARELREHRQRRDPPSRGPPFEVRLVGAEVTHLVHGDGDASMQFARGLLERVERQFVERGEVEIEFARHPAYPTHVNDIGITKHLVIFTALIINLWIGGDLIEGWLGHAVRTGFELVLILGYMVLILGITAPLPWRRKKDEESSESGRSGRS